MSYGLRVFTSSGVRSLDETYETVTPVTSVTVATQYRDLGYYGPFGGSAQYAHSYSLESLFGAANATSEKFFFARNLTMGALLGTKFYMSTNYPGAYTNTTAATSIECVRCERASAISAGSGYGMIVKNSAGTLIFSSNQKIFTVTNVITLTYNAGLNTAVYIADKYPGRNKFFSFQPYYGIEIGFESSTSLRVRYAANGYGLKLNTQFTILVGVFL